MNPRSTTSALILTALFSAGCSEDPSQTEPDAGVAEDASQDVIADADAAIPETHALLGKTFDTFEIPGGGELVPCVQWTLNNEKPLYVNSVTMNNDGGFHHSNWYIVPEEHAPGDDGYFRCSDRGWSEQTAALEGTVLFAQSTQAFTERQEFPDGVVTKIPPNHKVIADVHFLNPSPQDMETQMRVELGILHPAEVETIVAPFQLIYSDLDIPAESESRFTGECNIVDRYEEVIGADFEGVELYYVLPHYHDLGNHFQLKILGGPDDGQEIYSLSGFNAEANGQTFHPPIDLTGARGFEFSCGFDNPRSESVGWGIGDQEMCMMLGYTNADALFDVGVRGNSEVVEVDDDGIVHNSGPCLPIVFPRNEAQSMPTDEELEAPLYVPHSDDDGHDVGGPPCEDTPAEAEAVAEPTLSNLYEEVFAPSCTFSACHGSAGLAADLSLIEDGLHQNLLEHDVSTPTSLPLVEPGDAQGSWLYQITSNCEPQSDTGTVSHMPHNSPRLLSPGKVALIRDWIDDGAEDN